MISFETRLILATVFLILTVVIWRKKAKRQPQFVHTDDHLDRADEKLIHRNSKFYSEEKLSVVLSLEEKRISRNYKPGWLYFQCKERGLLPEFRHFKSLERKNSQFIDSKNIVSAPLTIELVPASCWYSNLRSALSEEKWGEIKRLAYKEANYRCVICNGKGDKWPVEAHEYWSYDDEKLIQKLERVVALCPSCHEVKHFGLASLNGRDEIALEHLMKINNWSQEFAENYISDQFDIWDNRSDHTWSVDLMHLLKFGFSEAEIIDIQSKER